MSIPGTNNLFRSSNSQEMLNYLLSRLREGDLSADEALAILGAVHAELGKGTTTNPKVYQLYNNVLKTLQKSMPPVYSYVISNWGREKSSVSKDREVYDSRFDEGATGESKSKNNETVPEKGFAEIKPVEETGETEESAEEEELDDKEPDKVEKIDNENDESVANENEEGSDEEAEDKVGEQIEEKVEETEKSDEEVNDELDDEGEPNEVEEGEDDSVKNDAEMEQGEQNEDEESTSEKTTIESDGESGKEEPGNEGEAVEQETEWPEIEESFPEESLGGLGGEEPPEPDD